MLENIQLTLENLFNLGRFKFSTLLNKMLGIKIAKISLRIFLTSVNAIYKEKLYSCSFILLGKTYAFPQTKGIRSFSLFSFFHLKYLYWFFKNLIYYIFNTVHFTSLRHFPSSLSTILVSVLLLWRYCDHSNPYKTKNFIGFPGSFRNFRLFSLW